MKEEAENIRRSIILPDPGGLEPSKAVSRVLSFMAISHLLLAQVSHN